MNKKTAALIGLAFELTGLILVGVFLGHSADKEWGWKGLGVVAGVIVALAAWMFHLTRVLKEKNPDESK